MFKIRGEKYALLVKVRVLCGQPEKEYFKKIHKIKWTELEVYLGPFKYLRWMIFLQMYSPRDLGVTIVLLPHRFPTFNIR